MVRKGRKETETMRIKLETLDRWSRDLVGVSAWYGGRVLGDLASKCQARADRMRSEDRHTARRERAFKALESSARVLRSLHDPRVYAMIGKQPERSPAHLEADALFAFVR